MSKHTREYGSVEAKRKLQEENGRETVAEGVVFNTFVITQKTNGVQ